jgi:hypothetical protein
MYCYTMLRVEKNGTVRIKTCPYWSQIEGKEEYENGYCSYIEKGDWEIGGLLWDQCKECGVNTED